MANWCISWKPQVQAHLLAAGIKAGTQIEFQNGRYAMTNEFGMGAGLFGYSLKQAIEIYPQEEKTTMNKMPSRSYEDIQRQM